MHGFSFEYPFVLILLIIIPISFYLSEKLRLKNAAGGAKFSRLELLEKASANFPDYKRKILPAIYVFAVVTGIIALARPQAIITVPDTSSKIMIVFDISLSMEANDMKPDRLSAARDTAIEFIKKMPAGSKTGLEYFFENAYIVADLTFDKDKVIKKLSQLRLSALQPGTAIGTAINGALSSFFLEEADKTNNVIILITDGESNQGLSPLAVAQIAKKNGIKIFTIGIGSLEGAIVKGYRTYLDEGTLMETANITGGKYFHAKSHKELRKIYKELRKKTVSFQERKTELTLLFSGLSFAAFLTLIYLGISVFKPVF